MLEPIASPSTLAGLPSELLLNQLSDMIFVMRRDSADHRFTYEMMNPPAMATSHLREDVYGATLHQVLHLEDAKFLHSQYDQAYTLLQPVSFVHAYRGLVGESLLSPIVDASGFCQHIIAVVRDVTERVERDNHLQRLAFQDELTGLPNRHALHTQLQKITQQNDTQHGWFSLLLIDADGLKRINDTYGHPIGDLYLREMAQRLLASVQNPDAVARIGGDEFLIGLIVQKDSDAVQVADRILQNMRVPWVTQSITLEMSVSIGIATYPLEAFNLDELIRIADQKLYMAKAKGRRRYELIPD